MKLFADECVYRNTVESLRSWGHDVETVQDVGLIGHEDEDLLAHAIAQERVLITIDLDFSNIRNYPPKDHRGVIVLRIRPRELKQVHLVLETLLQNTSQEELNQTLVIVDSKKYRIRRH
jgi:predicted nuclease of predicted toxin-antitoxin system